MKICMITENYPPNGYGGGIFVSSISQRLPQHDITVLTPAYNLKDGITKEGKITVARFGKGRLSFFLKAPLFLLRPGKFDIYHAHSAMSGLFAKFASLFKGGRTILHVHGFRDKELLGSIKYFGQVLLTKLGYDRIISVDSTSTGKLEATGIPKEKISTIPCGVDTEKFRPNPKKQKNPKTIFLFVGRLAKVKDLPTLLKAAKMAQESNLPAEFWIVGEGEEEGNLKAFSKDNALVNVKFLGAVPHEKIAEVYQKADFFVLPSLSEGNPLVLLEAMACGLPIIVSDVPSLAAIADNSGSPFVFRKGDAAGLYSILKKSASLGGDELRKKARSFTDKNLGWDKITKDVEIAYRTVL